MVVIGILGHGDLPAGLVSALELITGSHDNVFALGLNPGDSPETFKEKLETEMARFDSDKFLFLVDLKGGTPCNIAARMTSDNHSCISGVNLPMVLQVVLDSQANTLPELAATAAAIGRESVEDVSEELRKLMK